MSHTEPVEQCFVCHFAVASHEPQVDTTSGVRHADCEPDEDDMGEEL